MKLLVLASRFPYPLEKGDKLRLFHQLRLLARDHRIVLVALHEGQLSKETLSTVAAFCEEVHTLKPGKLARVFSLALALFSRRPFQVAFFYQKSILRKVRQIVQRWQPERIYCQLVRMAPYAEALAPPVCLDFMDAFSAGMARRASRSKGLTRYFFFEESKRLRQYEQHLLDCFSQSTIISRQDARELGEGIHIIPNGVDLDYFAPAPDAAPSYPLVFVGNMGYFPNVKAAEDLVNKILPLLPSETRVLLAGARPAARVKALASERVSVTGWVEDIREAYRDGMIFVAPLFTGSGQQNKLLEAMALGIPCITTSLVNNALGASPGEHLLIADSPEEFSRAIRHLLNEPEVRNRLARAGRAFVAARYSWEASVKKLNDLLEA